MSIHTTTLAAWLADGPQLVTDRLDITTVHLTDRAPLCRLGSDRLYCWGCQRAAREPGTGPAYLLPPNLYGLLPRHHAFPHDTYPNDFTAISALSAALLTWAKEAAKLRGLRKTPHYYEELVLTPEAVEQLEKAATLAKENPPERDARRVRLRELPAHADDRLSVEAAEQLVALAEDPAVTVTAGEDLPLADREAMLRRVTTR